MSFQTIAISQFFFQEKLNDSVALFMSHVHTTVNNISAMYYQNERRYNYTTPKSFLEQISLYSKLLREKTYDLKLMITRLENGLLKLDSCGREVEKLKVCFFLILYKSFLVESQWDYGINFEEC